MNKEIQRGIETLINEVSYNHLNEKQLHILSLIVHKYFKWVANHTKVAGPMNVFEATKALKMDSGELNKELNELEACGFIEDNNGVLFLTKDFGNDINQPLADFYDSRRKRS